MPLGSWELEGPSGIESVDILLSPFYINTADGMSVDIKKGMGVGIQPVGSAVEGIWMGALVRVLPDYRFKTLMLFAIYPSRRFVDAKMKAWLEFLETYIPDLLNADEKFVN